MTESPDDTGPQALAADDDGSAAETAYNVAIEGTAWVTDLDALSAWLVAQVESDPVLTYLSDWKEPYADDYGDDEVEGIEVIAGDVGVTPLDDPGRVLDLALRFLLSTLPGVEVEDAEGQATEVK